MDSAVSYTAKRPRHGRWNVKRFWRWLLLLALVWTLIQAGLFGSKPLINQGGWPQFAAFWQAAFQPVLTADFLLITLDALLVTLAYAAVGTFFSLLIGTIFGLLASNLWWHSIWPTKPRLRRVVWTVLRALLAVPRGIHELIWGLFFLNILGLDPLVAILAIAIPYGATVAKIFAEFIDEGEQRPYFALLNSGVQPLKAFVYGLLPLILTDWLSYAFYRFECAIRAAAVLGVVGAGGLGYQILLSMQTLNYNETWTLFYALMLLSGLADFWSGRVRQRVGYRAVADAGLINGKQRPRFRTGEATLRWSLLIVCLLLPFSFFYLSPDWSLLWAERTQRLWQDMISRSWPLRPTWASLVNLWGLSWQTVAMSVLAAVLASFGGALLSFAAARSAVHRANFQAQTDNTKLRERLGRMMIANGVRVILLLMRAIPAPIWALVLLFLFFPGMLPGALALGIYNLGILGRLMAEVVENLDERPVQALTTLGASRAQGFFYATLPTAAPRYTALSLYRWEVAIRATVVVGLVGAGGLGRELTQQLAAFNYRAVFLTLIFYMGLTFAVDLVSTAVRRT